MGSVFIGLLLLVLFVAIIVYLANTAAKGHYKHEQREIKRAGNKGEEFFNERVKEILNENDIHLNNIVIASNGKEIEIDNLIINKNGIFIVEVKNYIGRLYGNVDDKYWTKYKTTPGGDTYSKEVKNPIKQARTQFYFLKEFLKENGIWIWIEPYAYLINGDSPVQDKCLINDICELEEIIHIEREKTFNQQIIDKTVKLLTNKNQ